MQRRPFVCLFILTAALFVPVLFFLGFSAFVVPTVCGFWILGLHVLQGDWTVAMFVVMHLILYLGAAAALAHITYWVISWVSRPRWRKVLQSLVLAGLFGSSFASVLTYGSFKGGGGTYNFWTAAYRFLEKRPPW